jgi:hypothetical protein
MSGMSYYVASFNKKHHFYRFFMEPREQTYEKKEIRKQKQTEK